MSINVNQGAVEQALKLVADGQYALNTVWASNEPSAEQVEAFRSSHGDAALKNWFLALDDAQQPVLPVGDFRRVHRSGVVAAKRHGEKTGNAAIVDAADSILDLFDRMNAC